MIFLVITLNVVQQLVISILLGRYLSNVPPCILFLGGNDERTAVSRLLLGM